MQPFHLESIVGNVPLGDDELIERLLLALDERPRWGPFSGGGLHSGNSTHSVLRELLTGVALPLVGIILVFALLEACNPTS